MSHAVVPLRELRFRKALSQADLAQAAGVSIVTVNACECGRAIPRPGTRRAIAAALSLPPETIAWRVPRPPATQG
jgi:transcriptional regulator with XRE-family HTH domain